MKTVKEVSKLTGISVRTLHYYDEIGLLKPAHLSEGGYRLYDGEALERLRQILFFKEFDMPLREIKAILDNPALDRNLLLENQKKILVLKKERLERIIGSMDAILKGENRLDFEVFGRDEIERLYSLIAENMTIEQRDVFIKEYGSMEAFRRHFLETAASGEGQKNFAKVVEWYGDKESALEAGTNPDNAKIMEAYTKRCEDVLLKLAAKTGEDVRSHEVKEIVGELDFVLSQLYQMKDMTAFMLDMSEKYIHNRQIQENLDKLYGAGSTEFIGRALAAFYGR